MYGALNPKRNEDSNYYIFAEQREYRTRKPDSFEVGRLAHKLMTAQKYFCGL